MVFALQKSRPLEGGRRCQTLRKTVVDTNGGRRNRSRCAACNGKERAESKFCQVIHRVVFVLGFRNVRTFPGGRGTFPDGKRNFPRREAGVSLTGKGTFQGRKKTFSGEKKTFPDEKKGIPYEKAQTFGKHYWCISIGRSSSFVFSPWQNVNISQMFPFCSFGLAKTCVGIGDQMSGISRADICFIRWILSVTSDPFHCCAWTFIL